MAGSLETAVMRGHEIFVFNHRLTNRIIYSLTREMRNNESIKQLTFVGKQTVPAALRRDHWAPMCVLSFRDSQQGMDAYTKLRQFRIRHETTWKPEDVKTYRAHHLDKYGKELPNPKPNRRDRMRWLMDQKANSIADIAAVLTMHSRPPSQEQLDRARRRVRTDGRPLAKRGVGSQATTPVLEFQGVRGGVGVWWANPYDAEFAATWPDHIRHSQLLVNRNRPIWPPTDSAWKEFQRTIIDPAAQTEPVLPSAAAPASATDSPAPAQSATFSQKMLQRAQALFSRQALPQDEQATSAAAESTKDTETASQAQTETQTETEAEGETVAQSPESASEQQQPTPDSKVLSPYARQARESMAKLRAAYGRAGKTLDERPRRKAGKPLVEATQA